VLISEISWAGTLTSPYDEYIELINKTDRPLYLNNWSIDHAAGSGMPLGFSGRIEGKSPFLIANYDENSDRTALTCGVQFFDPALSLPNGFFGPYILRGANGEIMDVVGDGFDYSHGVNTPETRASASRYTWASSNTWEPAEWYTEGESINLCDGTLGTPGTCNSDAPLNGGPSENDAEAMITEFAVDPDDAIGEDWVELLVLRNGSLQNLVVTDLDGSDTSITGGSPVQAEAGEYYIVIWHDYEEGYDIGQEGYLMDGNRIYIPDNPPTGTKDQIVLLLCGSFLDGLCYYTGGNDHFDNDEQQMRTYGWAGDPIPGKYAARLLDAEGRYAASLEAASWHTEAVSSPGERNSN
jgi:hypothetical protein